MALLFSDVEALLSSEVDIMFRVKRKIESLLLYLPARKRKRMAILARHDFYIFTKPVRFVTRPIMPEYDFRNAPQ